MLQSTIPSTGLVTVRTSVEFDAGEMSFNKIEGFDAVYMKGAHTMQRPGMPMVPVKYLAVAVPAGMTVSRLETRAVSTFEFAGTFRLFPEQEPMPVGQGGEIAFTAPDAETYLSDARYPGDIAVLDAEGAIAGQPIAWIAVYPVQYIPAAGKLILLNTIELTLTCAQNQNALTGRQASFCVFTENQRAFYTDMIKKLVMNPELASADQQRGPRSLQLPPGEFDHVIITSSALEPAFSPLVYWHIKKGMRDTVVTTEWIYANYPGPGDTLQIRQFVIDANASWGTLYFLMGGEYETVPCGWRSYYGESTPSDQFYSDFNDDWVHDVLVGRVAASSASEASLFIDKRLSYEKAPPLIDYPLEACLCGMDLDANTYGELLMEQVATYLPGQFTANKVYDSYATNHRTAFLNSLNAGQNIVGHCDHGETELMAAGWLNHYGFIHNLDVDLLSNDSRLCNVVSIGCKTTALDHDDCIAEHFVVYNGLQAGVSYTGNTRDGYYSSGNPFALSLELSDWWWNGLFVLDQDDLGKALVNSKHRFATQDNTLREHCEWTFNLLGDPAMPVWTDQPESLFVVHEATVPACTADYAVSVTESDGITPVPGALVCCWIPEQQPVPLYARAHTDSGGVAVLDIAPTTAGDTMEITVTKHNYLPYEGRAVVVPATGMHEQPGNGGAVDPVILAVHPNPFKCAVTISYVLRAGAGSKIWIYNAAGYKVKEFFIKPAARAGSVRWDGCDQCGKNLPSGVYFLKHNPGNASKAEKIILVR